MTVYRARTFLSHLGVCSLLFSCSGGGAEGGAGGEQDLGPPPGTLAVTVGTTPTRFEDADAQYDPNLGEIWINGWSSEGTGSLLLTFPGQAPGTFQCDSTAATSIRLEQDSGQSVGEYSTVLIGTCTVTVNSVGAVGEQVVGSFSGILGLRGGTPGLPSTLALDRGSFNVARITDYGE
jgi:hypothetical protein